MALLWAHQYDEPPPPSEVRPGLAPAVDPVFARALAKSPDARYDTCLAFVSALRAATAPGAAPADVHAAAGPGTEPDTETDHTAAATPRPPRWAEPAFGS